MVTMFYLDYAEGGWETARPDFRHRQYLSGMMIVAVPPIGDQWFLSDLSSVSRLRVTLRAYFIHLMVNISTMVSPV